MILACNNITKSFGDNTVLSNVSFHINPREKVAVVGINGVGKSTLLKIIIGELSADNGEVTTQKDLQVGYLAQRQDLDSEKNVYDELLHTREDILRMENTIRKYEDDMKHVSGDELETLMNTYHDLIARYEREGGYSYKSEVTGILKGLGFIEEEFSKSVSVLSGGEKTRISLGKLLLKSPDLIILDEPTNHLDMNSIAWLEGYLLNYKGAVLVVSHDRYFLDKVCTKVVELDHGEANTFEGNYTVYAEKSRQRRETLMRHYLNQQKEIEHQEAVIAKLRSFNREKSIKRAESREKMLEHMERIDAPSPENATIHFSLEPNVVSGNDVLSVKGLKKGFEGITLFDNINFEIKRGERVAIIGNNGTGKTTLLKIINGIITPDAGEIKEGVKVHIAYYDQEHHVLNDNKTIFDEISDAYPNMDNTAIRNTLAAFLFTGDDVFKLIKSLSGGEKGRVSLAKLMLSDANFIILDEPTNHLDIESKEILEKALCGYTGTILYVSHDRYFINKTATRILELTHEMIIPYDGNYEFYLEKKDLIANLYLGNNVQSVGKGSTGTFYKTGSVPSQTPASAEKNDWQKSKEEQSKKRKLQNDIKKIEEEIEKCENLSAQLDEELQAPENCADHRKLFELSQKKEANDERLLNLMEEWEQLNEQL